MIVWLFQSTLPVGGATVITVPTQPIADVFQSTLPVGGATASSRKVLAIRSHFNPRSPWGERQRCAAMSATSSIFQSTLPVGGATQGVILPSLCNLFQSTLPVGGATLLFLHPLRHRCRFQSTLPVGGATFLGLRSAPVRQISIHAPRGGSDDVGASGDLLHWNFNPRSPWGERLSCSPSPFQPFTFQSTLPVGGATDNVSKSRIDLEISIHAPRGGSDPLRFLLMSHLRYFNPRSPWGERRSPRAHGHFTLDISIHAPRGGSDGFTPPP